MTPAGTHEGGCFCGAVRYEIGDPFGNVAICHCLDCRRIGGAPFLAFVVVRKERYRILRGEPKVIQYESETKSRSFCGDCGTPLTYDNVKWKETVDVTVGSLDEPEPFKPTYHVWTKRELPWAHVPDDLPRFDEGSS